VLDDASAEKIRAFRIKYLAEKPPMVRFSEDSRQAFQSHFLDHIEFMMSLLEGHPVFPFESYSFGSELLDYRRGLAYEVVFRQLGHVRSLVVNTNIRNRPAMGTALRCMLEIYAFARYLLTDNRLEDVHLLEKLYQGRAFTSAGWYDFEKIWMKEKGEAMPEHAKKTIKAWFNLPHVSSVLKPAHDADKGAAFVYALYSEFIHPAFGRPREESEPKRDPEGVFGFGSTEYYASLRNGRQPIRLLERDIEAGSLCLELFWPRLLEIDPFFDEKHRTAVLQILAEQGLVNTNGTDN
jgi:hypothetical protein